MPNASKVTLYELVAINTPLYAFFVWNVKTLLFAVILVALSINTALSNDAVVQVNVGAVLSILPWYEWPSQ